MSLIKNTLPIGTKDFKEIKLFYSSVILVLEVHVAYQNKSKL